MIARLRAIDPRNAALWTTLAANVAAVLFLPPAAFVWLLVVDLAAGGMALGVKYWEAEHRAQSAADENVGLRVRVLALKQSNNRLTNEAMRLHLKLTDAELAAGLGADVVSVPLLRIVPPQRDGSEYEWPAIVRAVEGETGATS